MPLCVCVSGLPNAMGGYDDTPADMSRDNEIFLKEGTTHTPTHT